MQYDSGDVHDEKLKKISFFCVFSYKWAISILEVESMSSENITALLADPSLKPDYDLITDRLFIKLVPLDSPRLKYTHYRRFHDMAITYHILARFEEGTLSSLRFTHDMLRMYGVTPEKLHEDALKNMQKMFPKCIHSVNRYMADLGFETADNPLFMVTNDRMMCGAPVILYDGVLDEAAEKCGGSMFVIPSSTEEMMAVSDEGDSWRFYNNLLRAQRHVNCWINDPDCVLSDRIFHYDLKDRKFEDAAEYFRRKKHIR